MKKLLLLILIFITSINYAQVGINTTSPTNDLDINGGVRVRELQEGTVESLPNGDLISVPYKVYAFVVIDKNGDILKSYGIQSVTKTGNNYRCFFTNPMSDNDYIILGMGKNRNLSYNTVNVNYFDIIVDSTTGQYDFNVMIVDIVL